MTSKYSPCIVFTQRGGLDQCINVDPSVEDPRNAFYLSQTSAYIFARISEALSAIASMRLGQSAQVIELLERAAAVASKKD